MIVYRCKWDQLPDRLVASGNAGRWNLDEDRVIYASESRALSAFEVLVNLKDNWILNTFNFLGIRVSDEAGLLTIDPFDNFRDKKAECQRLGHDWYTAGSSLILKVPSVIIPKEWNYLINTQHPDFGKVAIESIEPFYSFDPRLYS